MALVAHALTPTLFQREKYSSIAATARLPQPTVSTPPGKLLPPIAAGKGWPCRFIRLADAFHGGKQVARDLRTSPRSRKCVWLGCRETGRCR